MAKPYNLDDTMYNHDWAVRAWLRTFTVNYGHLGGADRSAFPLLTVMATPQRAFATVADLLTKENWIAGNTPQMQAARAKLDWPILPLPVASVERDDPIISNELSQVPVQWRRRFFDQETGSFVVHPAPMYYVTQYRVTFWCVKKSTHAAFMEWMLSNLGHRGMGSAEVLIPVKHPEPWGTILQALRYTGSADLSDLEGLDARHIRSQLSFVLHTWLFRNPDYTVPPVYGIQHAVSVNPDSPSFVETFPDAGVWSTANLFTADRWSWPTEGEAEVLSREPPVQVGVDEPTDVAYLTRVLTTPDLFGRSIWSVSFGFDTNARFKLSATQEDNAGEESSAHAFAIPSGTGKFHRFVMSTGVAFSVRVVGDNVVAAPKFSDLDIRQVYAQPRIPPVAVVQVMGNTVYRWSGLSRRPYLVIGVLGPATGSSPTSPFDVTVADDVTTPVNTRTESISFTECAGLAMLTMPDSDTVSLTVPPNVPFVAVYVQVFDGPFAGSSV